MRDVIPACEEEASTDTDSYSEDSISFEDESEDSDSGLNSYSDTDTDSGVIDPTADAKIIFSVMDGTLASDDPRSAFTASMLNSLMISIHDFEEAGKELPINVLARICYNMGSFVVKSPEFGNAEVFKGVLEFMNFMLMKIIENKIIIPSLLIGDTFNNMMCSVSTRLKIKNRSHLKNTMLMKLMSDLDLNTYKAMTTNQSTYFSGGQGFSLFADKREINFTNKDDKLIYADYYFEDWDETLFDGISGNLYPGLKELIEMAARLGVEHAIITARTSLIELSSGYTLYEKKAGSETIESRDIVRAVGWAIHEQLERAGLRQFYGCQNIIYCNFHVAHVEDGKVKVASGEKAKSDKIADYKDNCAVRSIDMNKTLIFDDKQEVWTKSANTLSNVCIVDNNEPRYSTFTKMAHAITQRILYNEKVDPSIRMNEAKTLLEMLEARKEAHFQKLIDHLKVYIDRKSSLKQMR
jgi:hypothetical protein